MNINNPDQLFSMIYKSDGVKPFDDVEYMRSIAGVTILAESTPRMVVLKVTSDLAIQRLREIKNWSLCESRTVTVDLGPSYEAFGASVPPFRIVK